MQSEGRRRAGAASSPALRYSVHEVVLPSRTVVQYREVGREWKGNGGQGRVRDLELAKDCAYSCEGKHQPQERITSNRHEPLREITYPTSDNVSRRFKFICYFSDHHVSRLRTLNDQEVG